MASPVPVLPEVGSMIVPPGRRRPSCSAASIMRMATRSLIEPPGLKTSSFATIWGFRPAPMRDSRTSGVSPIVSRIDSLISGMVRRIRSRAWERSAVSGAVAISGEVDGGGGASSVEVGLAGFTGDRRWAFVRGDVPRSGFPWMTIREDAAMLEHVPRFVEPGRPDKSRVMVRTPGGAELDVSIRSWRPRWATGCG